MLTVFINSTPLGRGSTLQIPFSNYYFEPPFCKYICYEHDEMSRQCDNIILPGLC